VEAPYRSKPNPAPRSAASTSEQRIVMSVYVGAEGGKWQQRACNVSGLSLGGRQHGLTAGSSSSSSSSSRQQMMAGTVASSRSRALACILMQRVVRSALMEGRPAPGWRVFAFAGVCSCGGCRWPALARSVPAAADGYDDDGGGDDGGGCDWLLAARQPVLMWLQRRQPACGAHLSMVAEALD
jgi:hypothetical protein